MKKVPVPKPESLRSLLKELNILDGLMDYDELNNFIGVHEHLEIVYFNKEKFETLLDYLFTLYNLISPLKYEFGKKKKAVKASGSEKHSAAFEKYILDQLKSSHQFFTRLKELAASKGYRFNDLKDEFKPVKTKIHGKLKRSLEEQNQAGKQ